MQSVGDDSLTRALSRANAMRAMESSYTANQQQPEPQQAQIQSKSVARSLGMIVKVLGKKTVTSLQGKALFVDNSKTQGQAQSSSARGKKRIQRQVRLSNKRMKADGLASLVTGLRSDDVALLQSAWNEYAKTAILKSTATDMQIQSRLSSLYLIGATVLVLVSDSPSLIGVEGVIVSESSQRFGLWLEHRIADAPVKTYYVKYVLRKTHEFAVMLSDSTSIVLHRSTS